ncbi:hypothetical protein TALC_01119 [Thermoplasmatales archaeon BRNA1]|nr:hypothetical protein TALC_01119 [Thermoplasmatales archaeon BRNA1]
MKEDGALQKLRSNPRVIGAYVLDRRTRLKLMLGETGITASGGIAYENKGLDGVRNSDVVFCVFSKGVIYQPTEFTLAMADSEGIVYGHDVPKMMPRESIRDNGVWITDDFIVYPDILPKEQPKFVLYPHFFDVIGPAEGIKTAAAFNPAMTTDVMLKVHFGIEGKNISSTIITADYL